MLSSVDSCPPCMELVEVNTAAALTRTRTGGTPYGASHLAPRGAADPARLSEEERERAQLLGRRVAELAVAVRTRTP